jgi:hypothetical protein
MLVKNTDDTKATPSDAKNSFTPKPQEQEEQQSLHATSDFAVVTDYLESFVQAIKDNVDRVVEQRMISRSIASSSDSTGNPKTKKNVAELWKIEFYREKDRHKRKFGNNKRTIGQKWEKALQSAEFSPIFEIENAGEDHIMMGGMNEISTPIQQLSPIFELPLDDDLRIQNLDTILSLHDEVEPNENVDETGDSEEELIEDFKDTIASPEDHHLNNGTNSNSDAYYDAIFRSVSLLAVMDAYDWRRFDTDRLSNHQKKEAQQFNNCEPEDNRIPDTSRVEFSPSNSKTFDQFLDELTSRNYVLTPLEANLLLAYIVSSPDMDLDLMIDRCIQVYDEMTIIAESGLPGCKPDATTYRILILAFNKRFMAPGEAIKISMKMMNDASVKLNPEVFLEAMKACYAKMDIESAREMMNIAISNNRVRPSVESYIIFTDLMKSQDFRQEALNFLDRLHQVRSLKLHITATLLIALLAFSDPCLL